MKTKEELLREAELLEAQAAVNDTYRTAMERTSERTGGKLGHLNNPGAYAGYGLAGAEKRLRAAQLRAQANQL
jgi:hypothetical protein